MVTGNGYGLSICGCKMLYPTTNKAYLGYTFSLSMSVKDRPLQWTLGKSQIYYPEHISGYGRRENLLLSCYGFRLFLDRLSWWFLGGGPCTALSPGLRSGGLESKFGWGPGPRDRRVMGWSYLYLGYKWGVCFGVPSWAH